jgi:formylmethanofuran dehydrogenase subunit E
MLIRLRAWWYQRFVKGEAWPPDVREYILRSALKTLKKSENLSPETQSELARTLIAGALSPDENPNLSPQFMEEFLLEGVKLLGQIPGEDCVSCGKPVLTHEATMIDGKLYCKSCGSQKTS